MATKADVLRLQAEGHVMPPAMWRSAMGLAGRFIPRTLMSFRREIMPTSSDGAVRTRLSNLRRDLKGTGFTVDLIQGYRLVRVEEGEER
jgi:hypothetical protein